MIGNIADAHAWPALSRHLTRQPDGSDDSHFRGLHPYLSAVSNLVGVFPAESFPTGVRSCGIGLATAVSRFGSAVFNLLPPCEYVSPGNFCYHDSSCRGDPYRNNNLMA